MITQMRTLVRSRFAQALLLTGLVALVVVPTLMEIKRSFMGSADWIARVNGHSITQLDLKRQIAEQELMIQRIEYEYGPQMAQMYVNMLGLDKDQSSMAKKSLIQKVLLDDAAQTLSLPVSDETIASQFASVDPALFKNYLAQMGLTFDAFQNQQKNEIMRLMLQQLVLAGEYSSDFILKNYYQSNQLAKQFSFIEYSLDTFIDALSKKDISEDQLRTFFAEQNRNNKKYVVSEKRIGSVWKFDPSLYKIAITAQDLEAYYNSHRQDFKDKPVQLVVRRILFPVQKPEDTTASYEKAKELRAYLIEHPAEFAQKARELSQDSESAQNGGLLAPFAQGTHEKDFEKAAFLLEKNGDISDIVKTKDGFELIQREDKRPGTFKTLAEVEPLIRARLQQARFNNLFVNHAKDVVAKSGIDKNALENFVLAHGAKKQPLTVTAKDTHRTAQELFRLQEGKLTSYQEGDVGFIVLLEKIDPTYIHDFDAIKDRVRSDFIREQAIVELNKTTEEAVARSRGMTAAEFKKSFGSMVEQTGLISAQDQDSVRKLTNKGISPEALFQLEIPGSAIVAGQGDKKYVVHLDSISEMNEDDFAQRKEELRTSSSQMESQSLFDGFVASLYRTATIKQN